MTATLSCNVVVSYVTGWHLSESRTPRILSSAHFCGLKCLASRTRPLYPREETPVLTDWDNNLCLRTIWRNWRRENQLPLQGNKLRSLGVAVRSQPLQLNCLKKALHCGPLQLCHLCYTHGIAGDRPQARANWPMYRSVETTRVFKTGASFLTDNRNNKK